MSMKLSVLINKLQEALDEHGDMPVYTADQDIRMITITPCCDSVYATTDGVPDVPNEYYLDFIPG